MFKSIFNSAAAADGGSLALFVERLDGEKEGFVINRKLSSRGKPDYNRVTSDLRPLPAEDCAEIASHLEVLAPKTPAIHPVGEFIAALREQASKGAETPRGTAPPADPEACAPAVVGPCPLASKS